MPKQYEYKQFIEKVSPTDNFNTLDYLNEKGKEGWQLLDMKQGAEPSAISTVGGQPLMNIVVALLMMREKPNEHEPEDQAPVSTFKLET